MLLRLFNDFWVVFGWFGCFGCLGVLNVCVSLLGFGCCGWDRVCGLRAMLSVLVVWVLDFDCLGVLYLL